MGFYVPTNRDVKFPKACEQCHFYAGLICCVMDTYVHDPENKREDCPLIEIPGSHGRLIDGDKLERELNFDYAYAAAKTCRNAPTIIPKAEMV